MTFDQDRALYGAPELNRLMTEAMVPDLPEPSINTHVRQQQWIDLHAALDIALARLIDPEVAIPPGTLAALLDLHRYAGVEEAVDLGDARCRVKTGPLVAYAQHIDVKLAAQLVADMAT